MHAALIWIFSDLPLSFALFPESALLVIVSVSAIPSTKAYDALNSQSDIRVSHEADSFKERKAV
jgi:hypothetical protein